MILVQFFDVGLQAFETLLEFAQILIKAQQLSLLFLDNAYECINRILYWKGVRLIALPAAPIEFPEVFDIVQDLVAAFSFIFPCESLVVFRGVESTFNCLLCHIVPDFRVHFEIGYDLVNLLGLVVLLLTLQL